MKTSEFRTLVCNLIKEAKEETAKEKLPKSSGKLMDLKKELAACKQMKEELQTAKFAEKSASTEVEFANLQKFANELDKIKQGGIALENSIDNKIKELEDKISSEKNKIKEMIGLAPAPGQEKIEDVQKPNKEIDESKKPSVDKKVKIDVAKKVKTLKKATKK